MRGVHSSPWPGPDIQSESELSRGPERFGQAHACRHTFWSAVAPAPGGRHGTEQDAQAAARQPGG